MCHRLLASTRSLVIRVSSIMILSVIVAGIVAASTLLTWSMSTAVIVARAATRSIPATCVAFAAAYPAAAA